MNLANLSLKQNQLKIKYLLSCRARLNEKKPLDFWVAHHGLQRSGTNFLLLQLINLQVPVLNRLHPLRSNPRHKHFRWYDSEKIPSFIGEEYQNDIRVGSVQELNDVAQYPEKTRHIVIRKDEERAIASLMNWGLRWHWFSDRDQALAMYEDVREDYLLYYEFWETLASAEPGRVRVIEFGHPDNFQKQLHKVLSELGIPFKNKDLIKFKELPQSPVERSISVSVEDINALKSQSKTGSG